MKYRKSIRSLLCGLGAALLLLTCLPTAALAAGKAAKFTSMFPGYADGAKDPKAAEAVLAGMGTAIGQSRTVKGVTLTLNGAVWNDGQMLLSFSIKGAKIPKDIPSGTGLNRDAMQVTLAEDQREAFLRSRQEETEKLLAGVITPSTKEELDAEIQASLKRGEPGLFHLPRLVRNGGKDFLLLSVSIAPYVEQPKLTVHLENLTLFKNAEGKYWSRPYDGYEPLTLVSGPFDFTFTAEKHLKPLVYTGAVDMTAGGIPVQVRQVKVTAFGAEAEYVTRDQMDMEKEFQKLEPIALKGVWTEDGRQLEGTGTGRAGYSPTEGGKILGYLNNTHPYVLDPAQVTAVDISGVRVDTGKLTLQENPPLQNIQVVPAPPAAEQEKKTEAGKEKEAGAEKTAAQAQAEREKKLEEAKKIAYQDLKTASKEMQAKILEARRLIINSTSWVADGYNGGTYDADGKYTPLPHFSELFPGWELPKADS